MASEEVVVTAALVGESGVGKTSIVTALARGAVRAGDSASPEPTIGTDTMCIYIRNDDKQFKFVMFDTAGQERFLAMTKAFMVGKDVMFVVYALNDLGSINKAKNFWIPEILKDYRGDRYMHVILVGNKSDLVPPPPLTPSGDRGVAAGSDDDDDEEDPGSSHTAGASSSSASLGAGGRPEALIEAQRALCESAREQCGAMDLKPTFFETSAMTGANLAEMMAAVSHGVVGDRLERGVDLRTGKHAVDEGDLIDPAGSPSSGWSCC